MVSLGLTMFISTLYGHFFSSFWDSSISMGPWSTVAEQNEPEMSSSMQGGAGQGKLIHSSGRKVLAPVQPFFFWILFSDLTYQHPICCQTCHINIHLHFKSRCLRSTARCLGDFHFVLHHRKPAAHVGPGPLPVLPGLQSAEALARAGACAGNSSGRGHGVHRLSLGIGHLRAPLRFPWP